MSYTSEVLASYDEKFLNPDKFSSVGQFRPELAGKLPQEFKAFLISTLEDQAKAILEAMPKDNFTVNPHPDREPATCISCSQNAGYLACLQEVHTAIKAFIL